MKHLLSSFIFCIFLSNLHAQVLFNETFDGIATGTTAGGAGTYSFPAGWFLRNVDNRTPSANVSYVNEAWERREDFNFSVIDSCAFSTSWYNPIGQADDWMWTPLIGPLPANSILSWNAVAYDPSFQDGYEVRVMTQPQGPPTGGTGVIGNQVTNSTQVFSIPGENSAWTSRSVNLNAFVGQSVYIAFRNNSNDKFLLLIDDVKVQVIINHDAQTLNDTSYEYTQIPLSQADNLPLKASVRNNGALPITNVNLKAEVYNTNNVLVHSAMGTPIPSLASGATSIFTLTPWTPPYTDSFTIKYFPILTETDQVPTNDTLLRYVEITDSVYARDDGDITNALGIGAGNGGYLGQSFTINSPVNLTTVTAAFTRGYTGKPYAFVLWSTLPSGEPNAIIASTDTLLYTSDSSLLKTLSIYGGAIHLLPGKYVITTIEFDSTVQIALTANIFTPGTTWINWPTTSQGGWANNEDFNIPLFQKSYYIRLNFSPPCTDASIPTIVCPPTKTINCDESNAPANTGTATAMDDCDANPVISFTDVNNQDPSSSSYQHYNYDITRTWKALDASGKMNTCIQLIQVRDLTPPTILCPSNKVTTVNCPVVAGSPTITDNCGAPFTFTGKRTDRKPLADPFPVGTTQIRWTATDLSGNSSICIQTITVTNNVAMCPPLPKDGKPKDLPKEGTAAPALVFTSADFEVEVLPNPARDNFKLTVNSNLKEKVDVKIFDNTGKLIKRITNMIPGSTIIFGNEFSSGVYFAEILQGKNRKMLKLVKTR